MLKSPNCLTKGIKIRWFFYYDTQSDLDMTEAVNVFNLLKSYPKTIKETTNAILINLSIKYPNKYDSFTISDLIITPRILYPDCKISNHNNLYTEIESLITELTYNAWDKIDELKKTAQTNKQIFIAMSFNPDLSNIEAAIKKAIGNNDYTAQIIKDKEHNNYIVPEILYEIENSKAVVMDITEPNYGAYLEAGYAMGLGKEVIICCREDSFKPHFDISQKSTILWADENDLITKLTRRIQVTVK